MFYLERNLKESMLFFLEKTEGIYVNESRSLLLPDNETIINLVNTCKLVTHVKIDNFFKYFFFVQKELIFYNKFKFLIPLNLQSDDEKR